jgi:hypothetical protein
VLLETFVDPQRFAGTIYKAANWIYVGDTKGFFAAPGMATATRPSHRKWFLSNR